MYDYEKFLEEVNRGLRAINSIAEIEYHYNSRTLVYQQDKMRLYHYQAKVSQNKTPLLIVFATVNRPEILDIFPEDSFIRGLLDNGTDVYLLDWGYPDIADKFLSLDDYINYLDACVTYIKTITSLNKINLLGICQGGVFCLCYVILTNNIENLVLISTPIDFHTEDNTISNILRYMDMKEIIEEIGNISGAWLTQFFISLRPFELLGKKYLRFMQNLDNAEQTKRFLLVEKWLNDAPDQAARAFSEFVVDFYQQNKLIKKQIKLHGKTIDLRKLTIPVLNIVAREDEIIPISASIPLNKYISSSDYTQKIFNSGHIGIYVSDKVRAHLPKEIAQWLNQQEVKKII